MKYRLSTAILALTLSAFLMINTSLADSIKLTKIGSLSTDGKLYPVWWYTGVNPTFYGKADNGDEVQLKIGDKTYDTLANITGDWDIGVLAPAGDYQVTITSGDASYDFTLHLGQAYDASTASAPQTSSSTASVPSTGGEQTTALTLGLGVSLLALYLYFYDANKKHKIFEKKIVSDQ